VLRGLTKYLNGSDVEAFIDPLVRGIVNGNAEEDSHITDYLTLAYWSAIADVQTKIMKRMQAWINSFEQRENQYYVARIKAITDEWVDESDPFADE